MGRRAVRIALAVLVAGPALAQDGAPIVGRAAWGAKAPTLPMKVNRPVYITIHHTATPANPRMSLAAKLKGLQSFSQSRSKLADGRVKVAWADVPYHYYVAVDGSIGEGREVAFVGDTNTKYDPSGHIGIVVEGNFDAAAPTPAQLAALERLTAQLVRTWSVKPDNIRGHRNHAQTACPGKALEAFLPELRARVTKAIAGG